MKKLKIWHISDTHAHHDLLEIPKDIDIVIHSGDSTNYPDIVRNQPEFDLFIHWFAHLPIKHKILIAGNHDAWALKLYNKDKLKDLGIIYLEHEYCDIQGQLIFGSPYTPTFGNWHFMKDRGKLHQYWEALTSDIDILVTHGPPKFILDLSHNQNHELEYCGDNALFKKVLEIKPQFHLFGHIHNSKDCYNEGIRKFRDITFINSSVVTDGKFGKLSSNGNIFKI
jgi:Icc-related predicted phosphoesterase